MFKKAAPGFALCFALTALVAPVSRMHAQTPDVPTTSDVVTGTDPEPTGEPSSSAMPAWFGVPAPAAASSSFVR